LPGTIFKTRMNNPGFYMLKARIYRIGVFVLLDNIFCKPGSIKIGPGFMVLG